VPTTLAIQRVADSGTRAKGRLIALHERPSRSAWVPVTIVRVHEARTIYGTATSESNLRVLHLETSLARFGYEISAHDSVVTILGFSQGRSVKNRAEAVHKEKNSRGRDAEPRRPESIPVAFLHESG
jgi:hypothetical protein